MFVIVRAFLPPVSRTFIARKFCREIQKTSIQWTLSRPSELLEISAVWTGFRSPVRTLPGLTEAEKLLESASTDADHIVLDTRAQTCTEKLRKVPAED